MNICIIDDNLLHINEIKKVIMKNFNDCNLKMIDNSKYIDNEYNETLKKKNINVEKEIFISYESYLNDDKYINKIIDFLEKQYQYLHILERNNYHLSIYEKGDFTILKAIYDINDKKKIKDLEDQFEITDDILIIKQIIYKI